MLLLLDTTGNRKNATAPSDLTLSDFEKSNLRSFRFYRHVARKGVLIGNHMGGVQLHHQIGL